MDKIRISIGTISSERNTMRTVEFVGEEVLSLLNERWVWTNTGKGERRQAYSINIIQTLYRAIDDTMVVHTRRWSRWHGEPTIYTLESVGKGDLEPGGCFEKLGAEGDFRRPLTLTAALAMKENLTN